MKQQQQFSKEADIIAAKRFTATHDYLNVIMREMGLSEYDKYIFIQGWDEALKWAKNNNFTPYNPEDLTPLPEGYVDKLP